MKRIPFTFYKGSPTDLVAKFRGDKMVSSARGGIFFVAPWNTLARVSKTDLAVHFAFTELTADSQEVMVQGEMHIRLIAEKILERRDFTINAWSDAYLSDDPDKVEQEAVNALQTFVRRELQKKDLKGNLVSAADLQGTVFAAVLDNTEPFAKIGVEVVNMFITAVTPGNHDLKRALEAEAREKMLAAADKAVADRRRNAAESDRSLRQYEAETALKLEEDRARLVEARNANVIEEAKADAEANAKRLEPYKNIDAAMLLALGIRELAEHGNVGEINFTPELMAALKSASRPEA